MTVATPPAEMCRLVVVAQTGRIEVAVPADVLIGELLPALLHHLDESLADAGLEHGGWVLQRLGSAPFDEASTVAGAGLRDGETVHLRPRADQIPPVHFDDLADGIAVGVQNRAGRWQPEMIRWVALGLFGLVALLVLIVGALPAPALGRMLLGAVATVCCLAGALGFTRAGGDRAFGLLCAVASVGFAAATGASAPGLRSADPAVALGAPEVFTAAVTGAVTALLAAVLVGWAGPVFAGIATAGVITALGAGLAVFLPLSQAACAGLVAVVATVGMVAVPMLGFRLARFTLAPLPTAPEHLQEDIDPEPSEPLLARTAAADRYMTGLYLGLALPTAVALVLLGAADGWAPPTLLGLVVTTRLLSLRPMTSAWHRFACALPALLGVAVVVVVAGAQASATIRLAAAAALLPVGALLLFVVGRVLPGRRIMPYWGRIGDLLQWIGAIAMVPILLTLLGVYGFARGLGG